MKKILLSVALIFCSIIAVSQSNDVRSALQNYRYEEALSLLGNEPETTENLLLKASCHEKLYNYTDALAVYEKLLPNNPENVEIVISAAECASQAGATETALNYWIKADSLSPENLFFQTKKAIAYYRNGNWQETIESAQTVFQSDSIPLLLRMTGEAFLNLNDPIEAGYYYSKAYEKNPSDHLSLGRICEFYYAL